MGQGLLIRCPSCGAQIQADASHRQVTCLACGTSVAVAAPAPSDSGGVPRQILILIVLGALLPMVISGVVLFKTFAGEREQSFPVVNDYLTLPETVPDRVKQIDDQVRQVHISRSGLEVYDLAGQRYSISADGSHLERGGATLVPVQGFAVDDVDFAGLPKVLQAASVRSGGASPSDAVIEIIDGRPMWRITVWAESGPTELIFDQAAQSYEAK